MTGLRLSIRTQWAVLFGGLFVVAGAAMLLINYVLFNEIAPDANTFVAQSGAAGGGGRLPGDLIPPPGGQIGTTALVVSFRGATMQSLLVVSGIALVIAGAIAALLGWLLARRAVRPLHKITATARRLEAENLDRRINLDGPDDELKELADTFDGMLDRLATAFDGQRRFVANASHELRTPLAVQRTLIEVAMADPTASPELLRLGQHLLHTNERSERLIEGLLVLARSDQGLVSRAPVQLDELVDGVLRASAGMAAEQGVTLLRELAPRTVVGDHVLLERLVINLVHNAVHYNHSGGTVAIRVTGRPAFEIINTGPVVPQDAVPSLFEPFRRLDRDRTGGRNGAGLGLSIVRSVAHAHEGMVYAEANAGGGLRIVVDLPWLGSQPERAAIEPQDAAARLGA